MYYVVGWGRTLHNLIINHLGSALSSTGQNISTFCFVLFLIYRRSLCFSFHGGNYIPLNMRAQMELNLKTALNTICFSPLIHFEVLGINKYGYFMFALLYQVMYQVTSSKTYSSIGTGHAPSSAPRLISSPFPPNDSNTMRTKEG